MNSSTPAHSSPRRSPEDLVRLGQELLQDRHASVIERLPEDLREVARHHFGIGPGGGWVPGQGRTPRFRLAISVLLCTTIDGSEWGHGAGAAVAANLTAAQVGIHDNIMDADFTRYGRPTAWRVFGRDKALLAGNVLLALAFECLTRHAYARRDEMILALAEVTRVCAAGQCADVRLTEGPVTEAENLAVINMKTAVPLGLLCRVGALASSATARQVDAIEALGRELGTMMQLNNDLEDLWAINGKEPSYSDLRARKYTYPITSALRAGGADKEPVAAYLRGTASASENELAELAVVVERCGGRARTELMIRTTAAQALRHLRQADLPARPHADFEGFVGLIQRY
ncbi:polyprenyl synthetase family protein [Streptomyces sp. NBC_01304]|uniref:polyprenyl synthetase family protein n=1 Tax=Streptomyces sp. NBC_01304 TaxID=2903818 RepID=UPI002E14353B|nr:polyprenyl synthetase family protein [Streptomyces sp. NBC_01304]